MADPFNFNLKLVQEVEKHPCLYNFNLQQYSRKDITEKAWDDVGKAVKLTGSESKERWKNLRAVFVRHLKPGSGSKPNKPYYLADAMAFTLPFIKTQRNKHCISSKHDSDEEDYSNPAHERPSPCSSPGSEEPSPQHSNYSWSRSLKRRLEDEQDSSDCSKRAAQSEQEEANRLFLLSLLPDMNLMSPSQARYFKRRTVEVISDILEGVFVKSEQ